MSLRRVPALLLVAAALPWATGCVAPRLVDERCQAPYAGLIARYEASTRTRERFLVQVPESAAVGVALDVLTTSRGPGGRWSCSRGSSPTARPGAS
jgi:hypothetical protein